MTGFRPSLRLRLWSGATMLAVLAVIAAGIGVLGLDRVQSHASDAMAAQRRIEAYDALAARISEWTLGWLAPVGTATGAVGGGALASPRPQGVLAALDRIDRLVAEDVAMGRSEADTAIRARQSVAVARLRATFHQMDTALGQTSPGSAERRAALTLQGAQIPDIISMQTSQEIRRRDAALTATEELRRPLMTAAILIGIAAPLVLAGLYLTVLRPLFRRLSRATTHAHAIAGGAFPPGISDHDELGLMLTRLRRAAAQVERRRARLETVVAERTVELSAANTRLEAADRQRRRFFADVGHELRTPLTVILGEAELGRLHRDEATRASFATIQSRALRLFRRIEDLLRIARSESGQLELSQEPVDLVRVLREAQADSAPLLKRAGVTVRTDMPPLSVIGDPDWLRQVFSGLFDNAARHAGRGATVLVSGGSGPDRIWVRFADDGPGLAPGVGQAVFDRFNRSQTSQGFGVGLALARWIMETSGGTLTLEESGPGFALMLTLPPVTEG